MPKFVEDLVEKLLSDKDFYPNKSEKEQKAIAYAIAYKKLKLKKSKKPKKTVSNNLNQIKTAQILTGYSIKLENNNNYQESDELIKIVSDLIL